MANKMAEQKQAGRRERESRQPAKRETRQQSPGLWKNLRKRRSVAFLLEAYDELRHKVTWPTLQEARNMTIVVIVVHAAGEERFPVAQGEKDFLVVSSGVVASVYVDETELPGVGATMEIGFGHGVRVIPTRAGRTRR